MTVAGLVLGACGGGNDEGEGLAESEGVARSFCDASAELFTSLQRAAQTKSDFAALSDDGRAVLEVIPDDAPAGVRTYFEAIIEMGDSGPSWQNPETGGIKEEFLDEFFQVVETLEGDQARPAVTWVVERCQSLSEGPGGAMGGILDGPGGGDAGSAPVPSAPAEVLTLLDDGPAGVYEQVTLDIAAVTATDAQAAEAFSTDPVASARSVLLVEVEATTDADAGNEFAAGDFLLEVPGGAAVAAESIVGRSGGLASLQLRGRDSAQAVVAFPTESLVRDLRGYRVRVDRDDRVPTVLAFDGSAPSPYPVALDAGATGAFTVAMTAACTDDYETRVTSTSADLDADLAGPQGIVRSPRRQRWIRVVLDVTNVTVQGQGSSASVCQAFSGNFAGVELRLDADGKATAPANSKDFDQIEPGTTAERVQVFPVDADARALTLEGPAGEALGRWTVDLPPAPGES